MNKNCEKNKQKKNSLGESIYVSREIEIFYDNLEDSSPPPKWMREMLFEDADSDEISTNKPA